jgi:hypothetical protein
VGKSKNVNATGRRILEIPNPAEVPKNAANNATLQKVRRSISCSIRLLK